MFGEAIEKAKAFLRGRKIAYHQVFDPANVHTDIVLRDLAKFCRAHESTFHQDPRMHAVLEGRREVWLRIANHLNLDSEKLWELYGRKDLK